MKCLRISISLLFLLALIITGCGKGDSPVTPDTGGDQIPELTSGQMTVTDSEPSTYLWGYFDIVFDPVSKTIDVVPNRTVDFALNVVKFLNNDPATVSFVFNTIEVGYDEAFVDVDFGLTHPIDDAGFDAYDVRGIFIGNGSAELSYNDELVRPVPEVDQTMDNPDGYTRWWNPTEFPVPKIFGYIEGVFASKGYVGSATLNPYKYFGEGLEADGDVGDYLDSYGENAGRFPHATTLWRNYQIRFPLPTPAIQYNYAVVANWKGTDPGSHPSHAEEAVAVEVEDYSGLWYHSPGYSGGELELSISVYDWESELTGGVMEDYSIYIESNMLDQPYKLDSGEMTPENIGENSFMYCLELPIDEIESMEGNEYWVIVEYPGSDYTNPLGIPNDAGTDPLAAFFRFEPYIYQGYTEFEILTPNGGEEWMVGLVQEIIWDTLGSCPYVDLHYSKDGFVADEHEIATGLPASFGFWPWSVPDDVSDTVRIRVRDSVAHDECDISDADFSIIPEAPWVEVVTPNGGEEWAGLSEQVIEYETWSTPGTVSIEYSKDDFVSDINTIIDGVLDVGMHFWTVPNDPSDTVRVRVILEDYPAVSDVSDEFFSIIGNTGWVETWGDEYSETAEGLSIDIVNDHVYTTGVMDASTGAPGEAILAFLRKYSSSSELLWEKVWGNDPGQCSGTQTYCYFDNMIYVLGSFTGTDVDFDPGDGVDLHSASSGEDVFLSAFDPDGEFLWAKTWGPGSPSDYGAGFDLTMSWDGQVYVVGGFTGTDVDLNPDSGTDFHSSNGGPDAYIIKFSSDGVFQWATTWGGPEADNALGVASSNDLVYVTGFFSGNDVDFDSGEETDLHSSNGDTGSDAFLTMLDSTGDYQWTRTWGGADVTDTGVDVDVDFAVYAHVVGYFYGTDVDFDSGSGTLLLSSAGENDGFLCRYDSEGNLIWAGSCGGSSYDSIYGVSVSISNQDVIIAGSTSSTDADLDPTGGVAPYTSNGESDAFLIRLNTHLEYVWSRGWGGTGQDYGRVPAVHPMGYVYLSGRFNDSVEFAQTGGPCFNDSDIRTSNGDADAFLIRFMPVGCW